MVKLKMAILEQEITGRYAIYNSDSIDVMKSMPDGKVGLSIYSPPFATSGGALYTYSSDPRDLSNCVSYEQFFEHYDFMVKEIYRITMPGRMTAVHCTDIPTGNSGDDALIDFPGDIIRLHKENGWRYVARYSAWKEPLAVRNRTMAKNLAHKTIVEDSSKCSVASADYLLVFRRKGENKIPISHPVGLMEYAGSRKMPAELLQYKGWTGNQIQNRYSHWIWRQYASAFWDDIRLNRVLPYLEARDSEDERHVHPLQLDVIERLCILWSNPGEIVLTPCMGVGSEVCGALANNRMAVGIELKPSYFRQAKKNILKVLAEGLDGNTFQDDMEFSDTEEIEGAVL